MANSPRAEFLHAFMTAIAGNNGRALIRAFSKKDRHRFISAVLRISATISKGWK